MLSSTRTTTCVADGGACVCHDHGDLHFAGDNGCGDDNDESAHDEDDYDNDNDNDGGWWWWH